MGVLDGPGSGSNPPDDPAEDPTANTGPGTTPYLGNVKKPTIKRPAPSGQGWGTARRQRGQTTVTSKGYKKGDQVALLPKNGEDLKSLQVGLYQAGYISDAQLKNMALGSPDEVTTGAFAKLLASSNMTGMNWRETLSQRLAAKGAEAPEEVEENPPLTIELTDPTAIKTTLQTAAKKLLGGYMDDAQADAFVAQFQAAQTASQTQAYNQMYAPNGEYGPGGSTETITADSLSGMADTFAMQSDPEQYKATQFGSEVTSALQRLRQTGYAS